MGCPRLPLLMLFLTAVGIVVAYFGVFLTIAVKDEEFGIVHSPRTQKGQLARPLPVGSVDKLRSNPEENSQGSNAQRAASRETQTPPFTETKAKGLAAAGPATNTSGARGRANFRNVVFPHLPINAKGRMAGWMAKPKGFGVKPEALVPTSASDQMEEANREVGQHNNPRYRVLKAFVEPIDFKEWEEKPLPLRSTATAEQLEEISFPELNSCSKLPEMIPADGYPDHDPFLPWIHDVFPTTDGKYIQFIAQNRRRCHTGSTASEKEILHLTQPNIALFQHVPVKRVQSGINQTRYRLASHEEADPDGMATRFICRFKPSMEETLSVYNFDYDFASHRKRLKNTFQYNDGGILSVHLSQFVFKCPVPEGLVDAVKSGSTVKDDWATLFVDVIPIRTPPRYGLSNEFLQPHYSDRLPQEKSDRFDPEKEWGNEHILPLIENSGRWENIPICKPPLKAYNLEQQLSVKPSEDNGGSSPNHGGNSPAATTVTSGLKKHRLIACIWASAGYSTRGNRFAVNDGQRRLLEWIHFNKLLGFEHFYLYDNSYAFSNSTTLKPIADLFPNDVTYIKWPFQVCNNNPNNVDSPGERSSQYAAESSCRLRFGPHTEWIGQFDIDEYFVPMGNYTSILPILDNLDTEGKKILSFGSWRAWPRRDMLLEPIPISDPKLCNNQFACFDLQIPKNTTFLRTYNCDRQSGPKKDVMPAEKQFYRPDHVLQHFIHYSSVTVLSQMNRTEFEMAGYKWLNTRMTPDPLSRFSNELEEATMLHTKAVARQDTAGWLDACKDGNSRKSTCRIGAPFPVGFNLSQHGTKDEKGWLYNCYINPKVENYWAPRLMKSLKDHGHCFSSV